MFHDITIDVFTTHLVSYTKADDNKIVRYKQASETVELISKSDADIVIFGGDINANPIDDIRQPYGMLRCKKKRKCLQILTIFFRSVLNDALTEKYPEASSHPIFATFGNSENTYTRNFKPERIDYLMYR